jgi:hypothetical protein
MGFFILLFGLPIAFIIIGYNLHKKNKNSNWGLFLMIFGVIILIAIGACVGILSNKGGVR